MEEKLIVDGTNKQSNYNIWTVVAILLLIVVALIAYKFKVSDSSQFIMQATMDESCDLHKGSCKLAFADGGSVSLLISPKTIPLLERLHVRVEVEGIPVSKVEIDFSGVGIDMGYNRPELKALTKTTFVSDAFLPVCTLSEMDWNAKVLLHTDKGLLMAPYKFNTIKKSTVYDLLR
jgi:hypothetical protein